jgi:prophage tail gpP-like protein
VAAKESLLTVRFSATGVETRNITKWSIDSAYLVSTDGFEFELFDPEFTRGNRLELQPVELLVNGASQLIGRIDRTRIGDNGRALTCIGRDYIADLVEGNVDPKFKLGPKMTVDDMLTEAFGPYGIDTIIDDDDDTVIMQNARSGVRMRKRSGGGGGSKRRHRRKKRGGRALQNFDPKPGEGGYEYCNKIIARLGATIQPGPSRSSLVITEPRYDQEPIYSLRRTDDPVGSASNNVIDSVADRDYSKMPTFTLFNATQATKGKKGESIAKTFDIFELAANSPELLKIIQTSTISGRWEPGKIATEVRDEGKLYRLLNFRDDAARTKAQLERAADRAVSERVKDTLSYQATVRGHMDERTGAIYSVDTMVRVDDDICDIHEELWISSRKLSYSEGAGATTQLTCWRPDSFVIDGSLGDDDE